MVHDDMNSATKLASSVANSIRGDKRSSPPNTGSQSTDTSERASKTMGRTEDERRLLPPGKGDTEEDEPDTVTIRKPETMESRAPEVWVPVTNRKLPYSSLRPLNTLGSNRSAVNVFKTRGWGAIGFSDGHSRVDTEPAKKRRRLKKTDEIEDSEGEDELSKVPRASSRNRSSQLGNGGPSGKRSSAPQVRIDNGIQVREYGKVEENMDSNPYGRIRRGHDPGWSVQKSIEHDKNSDVVEFVGVTRRPQYNGTLHTENVDDLSPKKPETSSLFFHGHASPLSPRAKHKTLVRGTKHPPERGIGEQKTIRTQALPLAGISISSDELQHSSVEPAMPPPKSTHHQAHLIRTPKEKNASPNKQDGLSNQTAELEKLQIDHDNNQAKVRFSNRKKDIGFTIKTFATADSYLESDAMGLVLDKADATCGLVEEGQYRGIVVQHSKILRVLYSEPDSNRKVRLESSLSADAKDSKVDIMFSQEVDFTRFKEEMRYILSARWIQKSSDDMDRMFAKRRKEYNSSRSWNRTETRTQPLDDDLRSSRQISKRTSSLDSMQEPYAEEKPWRRTKLSRGLLSRDSTATQSRLMGRDQEDELREVSKTEEIKSFIFKPPKEFKRSSEIDETLQELSDDKKWYSRRLRSLGTKETSTPEEVLYKDRFSVKHGLGKPWKHPLVYPPNGKKKITVDFSDLPRLDEGEYLNDSLVEFYLRYVAEKLNDEDSEVAKTIYWFNTYLFTSLTKGKQGKRINYESVKKWTRSVDIFNYDYIIVPINEATHWYVVIIANLPSLVKRVKSEGSTGSPITALEQNRHIPNGTHEDGVEHETENKVQPDDATRTIAQEAMKAFPDIFVDDMKSSTIVNASESDNDMLIQEHPSSPATDQGTKAQNGSGTSIMDVDSIALDVNHEQQIPSVEKYTSTQKKAKRKSNLPALRTYGADEPAIITLDSLGLQHPATVRVLKDYLIEEAEDKRSMKLEAGGIRGITAKGIPLQTNYCDCGLYLLGYMDKFSEGPRDFVTKLLQRELDETRDWPKLRPKVMRAHIRKCVRNLHDIQESDKKQTSSPKVTDTQLKAIPSEANLQTKIPEDSTTENSTKGDVQDSYSEVFVTEADVKIDRACTRKEALESARSLDEPDHGARSYPEDAQGEAMNDVVMETSMHNLADEPLVVVPDSQESTALQHAVELIETDNEESYIAVQRAESVTPQSRPKTRGKPEPDYEEEEQHLRKKVKTSIEPFQSLMGSSRETVLVE